MREVFLAEAVKIGLKHCYACAVNSSLNVNFLIKSAYHVPLTAKH